MKNRSLAEIIASNLRKALWGLLLASLAINAVLVVYDVQSLTKNIYDTFSVQLQNVARVSSQRGDMLSLQKDLEAVAAPLAEAFSVDIEITDMTTQKMIVDIPGRRGFVAEFFTRTVKSVLEVNPVGSLAAVITFDISKIVFIALLKALLSSILIVGAILMSRRYLDQLNRENLDPIDRFSKWLDSLGPEAFANKNIKVPTEGLQEDLKLGLEAIAKKMSDLSAQNAQLETEKQVGKIARRVAHDIRSPLSALNMLVSSVNGVTDEQKEIISHVSGRINMIANNLLESTTSKSVKSEKVAASYFNLEAALAEIMQEKSFEYNRPKVNLESRITGNISKTRVPFEAGEFKRILSNLINNSFESITDEGSVIIDVWATDSKAHVRVTDTGKGIPESILAKLTHEQISSKPQGAGIGLYSASEMLKKHGHRLQIQSKEQLGTQVSLDFTL